MTLAFSIAKPPFAPFNASHSADAIAEHCPSHELVLYTFCEDEESTARHLPNAAEQLNTCLLG
jgi:hypothetical protein